MKRMDEERLWHPRPEIPYSNLSFEGLCKRLRDMDYPARNFPWILVHVCNLRDELTKLLDDVSNDVKGLDLAMLKSGIDSF
jgi:hypothetical protein